MPRSRKLIQEGVGYDCSILIPRLTRFATTHPAYTSGKGVGYDDLIVIPRLPSFAASDSAEQKIDPAEVWGVTA